MLPQMVKYTQTNKDASILSKVYGIYKVKMQGVDPIDLII